MSVTVPTLAAQVPGYLGLLPDDHGIRALLRFAEADAVVAPVDDFGELSNVRPAAAFPAVDEGYTGRARIFDGTTAGIQATDATGRLILPRTVSVIALASWDSLATSGPDTLIVHGARGTSTERRSWGLRVAKPFPGVGRLEWVWEDRAGVEKLQPGGEFFAPASGFLLLAATREWAGTRFLLRYWAGETLLAEHESTDLEVGGGFPATVTIGCAGDGLGGTVERWHGAIDQLAVFTTALTQAQVSGIWRRLATWQPGVYGTVRALQPPGTARTRAPDSLVERKLRVQGGLLGTAAAEIALRADAGLPDRAYGPRLASWESVTGQRPSLADGIATRRARVLATFKLLQNLSESASDERLAPLIGNTIEYLRQGHDYDHDFADGMPSYLHRQDGGGSTSLTGTAARLAVTASQPAPWPHRAVMFRAPIEGAPLGFSAGIVVDTAASTFTILELSGLALFDVLTGAGIFLGITGSTPAIVRATLDSSGASGVTQLAASVAPDQYLRIAMIASDTLRISWDPDDFANPASSTTVAIAFTPTHVAIVHTEASGGAGVPAAVAVKRFMAHHPNSERIFAYTAYRDPVLPGPLDLDGARLVARRTAAANAQAMVATVRAVVCSDRFNGAGHAPLGEAGHSDYVTTFQSYVPGATLAHLWVGTPEDRVTGDLLTAEAGASQGFTDTRSSSPLEYRALKVANGTLQCWRAADAAIGDWTTTRSSLVALAYNIAAFTAGTFQQLLSKCAMPSGTSTGWELFIAPSQRLTLATDDPDDPAAGPQLPTAVTWVSPGWRVVLLRWNATTSTAEIANRSEQASFALPGRTLPNSNRFAIGAGRGDQFAPTFDAAFAAIWEGPAVESVNLLTLAAQLEELL
jgi:hypothetical protein